MGNNITFNQSRQLELNRLKKNIKYLLSLFLVFGLVVTDCSLYSQSNSADYYQFSNVILRTELNKKDCELYVFKQVNSSKKITCPILFSHLKFKDFYSLQVKVFLKTQTKLYQEVSSIMSQNIFVNELITSKKSYKSLYIA